MMDPTIIFIILAVSLLYRIVYQVRVCKCGDLSVKNKREIHPRAQSANGLIIYVTLT